MKNLLYALSLLFVFTSCEKDDDEPNNNSGPDTPVAIQLESIVMVGFDQTDSNGEYWDSSTNPPDPYVDVFKSGALVYTSNYIPNAGYNTTYSLNSGTSGAIPIVYTSDEYLKITVREGDGGTLTDYMGQVDIADALNFFYNEDEAEEFVDVEVSTSNGAVRLQLSGSILY
jgi:hypothetical protein